MAVTLYRSTDASAPSLTGTAGSLITLLDAILVNGYGSQPAAGWTKAFSGTNAAAYRMATTGNTGFYLDVNDNAPSTARDARMRGYEVMTAVGTGTGPFPTTAQFTSGVFCRKSSTADATARPWYCIADNSVFYLFVDTGDQTGYSFTFSFGDFFSYKSGDTYNCQIVGRNSENNTQGNIEVFGAVFAGTQTLNDTTARGSFVARIWTGTGGSLPYTKSSVMLAYGQQNTTGTSYGPVGSTNAILPYPNGPDGGLELAPLWIQHSNAVRGYLKGVWAPLHAQPLGHGDTFSGTGNMSGKTFIALNIQSIQTNNGANTSNGQIVIETSNTWS